MDYAVGPYYCWSRSHTEPNLIILLGRGKSYSLFGDEEIRGDKNRDLNNIVVAVYEKIKEHVERTADKFFVFSLSVCEVFYDEDECYENVLDLFDFSGTLSLKGIIYI